MAVHPKQKQQEQQEAAAGLDRSNTTTTCTTSLEDTLHHAAQDLERELDFLRSSNRRLVQPQRARSGSWMSLEDLQLDELQRDLNQAEQDLERLRSSNNNTTTALDQDPPVRMVNVDRIMTNKEEEEEKPNDAEETTEQECSLGDDSQEDNDDDDHLDIDACPTNGTCTTTTSQTTPTTETISFFESEASIVLVKHEEEEEDVTDLSSKECQRNAPNSPRCCNPTQTNQVSDQLRMVVVLVAILVVVLSVVLWSSLDVSSPNTTTSTSSSVISRNRGSNATSLAGFDQDFLASYNLNQSRPFFQNRKQEEEDVPSPFVTGVELETGTWMDCPADSVSLPNERSTNTHDAVRIPETATRLEMTGFQERTNEQEQDETPSFLDDDDDLEGTRDDDDDDDDFDLTTVDDPTIDQAIELLALPAREKQLWRNRCKGSRRWGFSRWRRRCGMLLRPHVDG